MFGEIKITNKIKKLPYLKRLHSPLYFIYKHGNDG
jgi:hypothetical protein